MNPNQPVSYNSSPQGGRGKILVIILLVIALVASLGFGFSQYTKAQDYKDNVDKKVNQAVAAKATQLQAQTQQAFDAANTYQYAGSATYGTVTFSYPKSWSAYVDTSSSNEPINGYFHPSVVPGIQSGTAFALRVELTSNDYSQVMQSFNSSIKTGTLSAKAYVPPKLKGVANVQPGTLLTGQLNSGRQAQNGQMLVIKVRDKTLQIYTESNDYLNQFNNILASLTFVP